MNTNWEIWLNDARGRRVKLLDNALGLSLVMNANEVGQWSLPMPHGIDSALFGVDSIIEFWRAPQGGALQLLPSLGFVRSFAYSQGEQGDAILTVSGPDQNDLLARRIVAYRAGSSYTSKSNQADDMMRDVVRENLGANCTDADRQLTAYGLTVEDDLTLGPSVDVGFAWQGVLETVQKIATISAQAGTPLYFRLAPSWASDGTLAFKFQVVKNFMGQDRVDVGSPVVFGDELGNLSDAVLVYEYADEVNYVYAGGAGEEDYRYVYETEDTAREGTSVWNRREAFVDARNLAKTEVQNKAREALQAGEPTVRFSGKLLESNNSLYGLHWNFGDKVSASFCGRQFTGMVKAVRITVDENGNETVEARLEV